MWILRETNSHLAAYLSTIGNLNGIFLPVFDEKRWSSCNLMAKIIFRWNTVEKMADSFREEFPLNSH